MITRYVCLSLCPSQLLTPDKAHCRVMKIPKQAHEDHTWKGMSPPINSQHQLASHVSAPRQKQSGRASEALGEPQPLGFSAVAAVVTKQRKASPAWLPWIPDAQKP